MSAIYDGGSAVPFGDYTNGGEQGMSLRDWFAGQALSSMASSEDEYGTTRTVEERAAWAYEQADAMLAARKGGCYD